MNEVQHRVLSKLDRDELARITREFVEIPSPTGEERAAAEYLANLYRGLGLPVQLQEVEPGRPNVVCTWKGRGGGKSLMFSGHLDTSRGYYEVRPFVDGDWLYGPGANNMKGGLTAAYAATKAILEAGVRLKGDLINTAVVGEIECSPVEDGHTSWTGAAFRGAGLGSEFMLRHGVVADMAVLGEPTGLRVQCGNCGYVFVKITTFGKIEHTHTRHQGISALDQMLPVIEALKAWEPEFQSRYRHERMLPLINIGAIVSGRPFAPVNTPAWCNLFVHVTTIPNVDPLDLKAQISDVVASAGAGDPRFKADVSFFQVRTGYEIPEDSYVAEVARRAHLAVVGEPSIPVEPTRYSVSTDGSFFARYGIPAITYGPAGITRSGARSNRDEINGQEPLSFEHLAICARVFALTALEACGGDA